MLQKLSLPCLAAALCTSAAWAQTTPGQTDQNTHAASPAPVAYVYVSSRIGNGSSSEVFAYAAASNGKLTSVSGSPFADNLGSMAVNGKYLFGSNLNGTYIDAYNIESNGALRYSASTDVLTPNQGCGYASEIFLDHTGGSLYNSDYAANACSNNTYETFGVVKSTGKLTFLGDAGDNEEINSALSFIGNNQFAYSSDCYHFGASIYGFQRKSNGSLTTLNINPALPKPPANQGYCPYLAVADPTNHVAIAVEPLSGYGDISGPYQIATYTAGSTGNLTTTSTYSNMPKVSVGGITDMNMSPSGKLLAVGGTGGLQIFHFNGASPVTHYSGLLTSSQVDQFFWDNSNHLYAIGQNAKKLWVWTITPTSYSQAPGSPYTINAPLNVVVQPLPL
jgi:hypothetical protein